jgi:hypothetical protein
VVQLDPSQSKRWGGEMVAAEVFMGRCSQPLEPLSRRSRHSTYEAMGSEDKWLAQRHTATQQRLLEKESRIFILSGNLQIACLK